MNVLFNAARCCGSSSVATVGYCTILWLLGSMDLSSELRVRFVSIDTIVKKILPIVVDSPMQCRVEKACTPLSRGSIPFGNNRTGIFEQNE
jgi:hypothetical protein